LLKPVTVRRDGLFAARSQAQDAGELTAQVDAQLAVTRRQGDLLDEVTQDLGRFSARAFPLQSLVQVGDLLTIIAARFG
jgi:hypothetical protein